MKLSGYLFVPGLVLLSGCATSTSSPMRQASAAYPTLTYSTPALTPVVTTVDDPRLMAANRYALEQGYKIETHQGAQFYCRTIAPTGSRLTQKECLTVDTMVLTQKGAEQNNTRILLQPACPKMGCGAK